MPYLCNALKFQSSTTVFTKLLFLFPIVSSVLGLYICMTGNFILVYSRKTKIICFILSFLFFLLFVLNCYFVYFLWGDPKNVPLHSYEHFPYEDVTFIIIMALIHLLLTYIFSKAIFVTSHMRELWILEGEGLESNIFCNVQNFLIFIPIPLLVFFFVFALLICTE